MPKLVVALLGYRRFSMILHHIAALTLVGWYGLKILEKNTTVR